MANIDNIEKQIEELALKHKVLPKHSDFQIEHFMLGKEVTTNGKIWQCIRELGSRNDNIKAVNLELEETIDNIELAKLKLEYHKNKPTFRKNIQLEQLAKQKKEIYIRKLNRRIQNLQDSILKIQDRKEAILRECKVIIEVFNKLNPENKVIDIDNKDNQIEYWNTKLADEININALLGIPPSPELIKSVLALPNDSPTKIQLTNAFAGAKKLLN